MQKMGHPLNQFAIPLPAEILDHLCDEFSITTAEELVSASANCAAHLRNALDFPRHEWDDLVRLAYNAVEPSIRDFLAEPLVSPFGKGAVLCKSQNLPGEYLRYLG